MASIISGKKRIAILTGGGDVPGLNPAIRAVTIRALREGWDVIGLRRGWAGVMEIVRDHMCDNSNNFQFLTEEIVNRAGRTGGTFLHTSRTRPSSVKAETVPQHLKSQYNQPVNDLTPEVLLMLTVAGMVSWLFILSVAAWILFGFFLVFALLVLGNLGAMYGLIFVGLFSGLAVQSNEVLDTGTVFYYLRDTLLFRPMKPRTMLVQEELDKKEIRDVYRETSGTPFPVKQTQKRLLTEQEIQQIHRELHARGQRPSRSNTFDEELKSLKSGAITSLADPWKVNTFDHKFHDWYVEMSQVEIDPSLTQNN